MDQLKDATVIPIGVVGLGLMGCSIATCLAIAGHPVVAVAPIPVDMTTALTRITTHLSKAYDEGLINELPEKYLRNVSITEDYSLLKDCKIVIECTIENI